jgi:hypothetical protein
MLRRNLFGTEMSLIETAGIFGDKHEDVSSCGNQFMIPVYGYDYHTGASVLSEEHRVRVSNDYTTNLNYDVFFFEECVVYDTAGGLIVVRDAK